MRRIGEPYVPNRPWRRRMGAYGVISGPRGLLCVDERGELQLPGGGIDPGEAPIQALHREVFEETGWRIGNLRRLGTFQRYTFMPDYDMWGHKVQLIFTARAVRPHGPPTEPWHRPLWLPPEAAAHLLDIEGDRAMVRLALARGLV